MTGLVRNIGVVNEDDLVFVRPCSCYDQEPDGHRRFLDGPDSKALEDADEEHEGCTQPHDVESAKDATPDEVSDLRHAVEIALSEKGVGSMLSATLALDYRREVADHVLAVVDDWSKTHTEEKTQ